VQEGPKLKVSAVRTLPLRSIGGTTYCAVAARALGPDREVEGLDDVARWAVQRQLGGFQGRPGKLEDVCYSFWIGAALQVRLPSPSA
jgi:geranylgeranyl transferase type-1 subunit beta